MRLSESRSRLFDAASSHVFGRAPSPQDESTPFSTRHTLRHQQGRGSTVRSLLSAVTQLFAAVGILYTDESPLRRPQFVTQKIACGGRHQSRPRKYPAAGRSGRGGRLGLRPRLCGCHDPHPRLAATRRLRGGTGQLHTVANSPKSPFASWAWIGKNTCSCARPGRHIATRSGRQGRQAGCGHRLETFAEFCATGRLAGAGSPAVNPQHVVVCPLRFRPIESCAANEPCRGDLGSKSGPRGPDLRRTRIIGCAGINNASNRSHASGNAPSQRHPARGLSMRARSSFRYCARDLRSKSTC